MSSIGVMGRSGSTKSVVCRCRRCMVRLGRSCGLLWFGGTDRSNRDRRRAGWLLDPAVADGSEFDLRVARLAAGLHDRVRLLEVGFLIDPQDDRALGLGLAGPLLLDGGAAFEVAPQRDRVVVVVDVALAI